MSLTKTCLSVLLITLSFAIHAAQDSSNLYKPSVLEFKHLTDDTLQVFIKNYGKDSLVKLISQRIDAAHKLIKMYNNNIKDETLFLKLKGINEYFKLGLDSFLVFNFTFSPNNYIRIYNKCYGDTADTYKNVKALNNYSKPEVLKMFVEYMYKPEGRLAFSSFCNVYNFSDKIIDTFSTGISYYPVYNQLEYFYSVSEYARNCATESNKAAEYRKKLFDRLYNKFSLQKITSDTTTLTNANYKQLTLTNGLELLATGLYGGDITINSHARDVIYLLTLQRSEGGWPANNSEASGITIVPTVYGYWALLQIREQLKKMK